MGNMNELMEQVRHRVTVADYYKMAEVGILGEANRVELIDGEIVDMAPIGSKHAFVVSRLAQFFTLAAHNNYLVSTQNPLRLDDRSEPQPDIALLKPGNYMERLPSVSDVLLIIEVAHSSINFDRGVKLDLYARHAIPEVWLLDLMGGELLVCRKPADGQYRTLHKPLASESVSPLLVKEVVWTLESGKSWSVPF
jgi:Uma2 family endonuclease